MKLLGLRSLIRRLFSLDVQVLCRKLICKMAHQNMGFYFFTFNYLKLFLQSNKINLNYNAVLAKLGAKLVAKRVLQLDFIIILKFILSDYLPISLPESVVLRITCPIEAILSQLSLKDHFQSVQTSLNHVLSDHFVQLIRQSSSRFDCN